MQPGSAGACTPAPQGGLDWPWHAACHLVLQVRSEERRWLTRLGRSGGGPIGPRESARCGTACGSPGVLLKTRRVNDNSMELLQGSDWVVEDLAVGGDEAVLAAAEGGDR